MNSPLPPAEETISRYLDEGLPPDELAAFSTELAQNPDTARAFARMARTDALIAAAFPPQPRRRMGKPLVWLAAAAAVAAGCFLAAHYWPGETQLQPVLVKPSPDEPPPPTATGQRRTVKPTPAAAPAAQVPLVDLFARYGVTANPRGLTVSQALAALEENIPELNLLNRPELAGLRFVEGTSISERNPEAIIASPVLSPLTIASYLDICCANGAEPINYRTNEVLAGQHTFVRSIHFSPDTHTFRVPPHFLATWQFLHPVNRPVADPFSSQSEAPMPPLPMEELARDYFGIPVSAAGGPSGARLRFLPEEGKLEVHNASPDELSRIERLVEVMSRPSRSYFLSVKLISGDIAAGLPGATEETGVLLNDADFQITARALSQTKGVDTMTTPSIITRTGQRGLIELKKEVVIPGAHGDNAFDWTGIGMPIEASPWGECIYIRGTVDIGTQEPGGAVRHDVTGFDLWLPNGFTGGFTLDTPGTPTAAFITVKEVDAAGQPR